MTISRSEGVVTISWLLPLPPMAFPLSSALQLIQVLVQPVVALLPETPVPLRPLGDLLERACLEPRWPPLPLPAPPDEHRAFEHLEVLRHGRKRHLERLRQLGDRRRPGCQPSEDGPPRGIRERRERPVQLAG